MRKILISIGCVGMIAILVLALFLASSSGTSSTGAGVPSVIYCGHTNDGAGTMFGVFTVTNTSEFTYVRSSRFLLQIPSITRRAGMTIRRSAFAGSSLPLAPGQFETVLVPVPTNGEPWRLYMFTRRDESILKSAARDVITKPADRLGFRRFSDKFRNFEYGICSDWVEP
jgi:hypothetical protein